MKKLPRKRRTRAHVIADLGIHHVEGLALRAGFVVERVQHDYGIDLELVTFDRRGEIEEGKVLFQVKATDRLKKSAGRQAAIYRIDRRDLVSWLANPMPVLLVLFDARREIAYWLYVQSYFAKLEGFSLFSAGKEITVALPLRNCLNQAAMQRLARLKNRLVSQTRNLIHDED